ncbi:MAG: helix-hairpin-helix domain-containing protein [Ignavibacteriae bacterium]|nr:helix-hairpin-helix domain-containing protein [Ignavibacteriota bacterium]NOG98777.1 helix-hairpin-helix domain-containing protein [Ignavibacteriota bacterium]
MKRIIYLILLLIPFSFTQAQTDSTQIIYDYIESLLEESTIDVEDSQLFDRFEALIQNPININRASIDQLLSIPFMDLETAELILNNRNNYGQFFTKDELNKIDSIDQVVVNKIKPFITMRSKVILVEGEPDEPNLLNTLLFRMRARATTDLQERRGFKENKYLGSRLKNYNRLKIISPGFAQLSVLTDKDPGEKSYGDFVSASASFRNIGFVEAAVLGDFQVEFGQGLALWSPFAFSKGSEAVRTVTRRTKGLKPYTSSYEAEFMRGAAAKFAINNFELTGFYSTRKVDATFDEIENEISTILVSGFHRTDTETAKKNNINEDIYGGILDYYFSTKTKIGVLHYKIKYDYPLVSKSPYDFSGKEFSFSSFTYSTNFKNILFSGEAAYNGISVASINNLQIKFTSKLQFVTSIRNYPRNYFNLRANGFGEKQGTQNEIGIYMGLRWRNDIGLINIYFDQFKFPTSTFSTPLPSSGNEFLIDYFTRPFSKTEFRLRYKRELKEVSAKLNDEDIIADRLKQQFRVEIIASPSKLLRLKTRAEVSFYEIDLISENETGFLIYQDIRFRPLKYLQFYTRFTFFDTKSYDTRIYAFENDLTGILTNNALFGKGVRWYFLVKVNPLNSLTISVKYAETYKPNENVLSSGLNEIEGNLDNRFSLQLDLSF